MTSNSVLFPRSHRFVTAAMVSVLGLGLSLSAVGQASAQTTLPKGAPAGGPHQVAGGLGSAAIPVAAEQPAAKLDGEHKDGAGLSQGIKIHGHWVIDIKNPDGTLVKHQEFENSLQYDGQQMLLSLLSGYGVMGGWEIYFTAPSGSTSPCTAAAYPYCAIVQSTAAQPGLFACGVYTCVPGLTVTPTFGVGASLVLAGSITAPNAGVVGSVGTGFNVCGNAGAGATYTTAAPAACQTSTTSAYNGTATYTNITPISVAAGQIIQVSVTLTFS